MKPILRLSASIFLLLTKTAFADVGGKNNYTGKELKFALVNEMRWEENYSVFCNKTIITVMDCKFVILKKIYLIVKRVNLDC